MQGIPPCGFGLLSTLLMIFSFIVMAAHYLGIELYISTNKTSNIFNYIIFENEFWKDIPNYDGVYKISSLGRIYSVPRYDTMGRWRKSGMKRPVNGRNKNYKIITLCKNKVKKSFDIHRLLMEVFYPDEINQCVNHKNGNKTHNWISNLEWTTQSQNILHAYRSGFHPGATGPVIMNWEKANEVRELSKTTSRKELAKMYGCSISCIREIVVGITWTDKASSMYRSSKRKLGVSGYRGVSFHKSTKKWRARIIVDGKDISLGLFENKELAAEAYQKKFIDLFGEI